MSATELRASAPLTTAAAVIQRRLQTKTLVYDLLTLAGGSPHDKLEGVTLVEPGLLVVSNNEDFGVIDGGASYFVRDILAVDWAHDSAWRFMPPVRDDLGGYIMHPVDLAVNKTLALAGRDEPRDFVDTLYVHAHVLPLSGLVWAAVGKDPGFNPLSLLEMLK